MIMWAGWAEVGLPTAEQIRKAAEKRASGGEPKLGAEARQESQIGRAHV